MLSDLTHDGADLPGHLGIGHTRWATHGEPNDINAHPHVSQSGRIAVVHNGIIENYAELKEQLLHKGYGFRSETDTEVVAQLLDYYYADCGDICEAMIRMLHGRGRGLCSGHHLRRLPGPPAVPPGRTAPLLLGFGEGENMIASDVTAIIQPHPGRRLSWTTASWPFSRAKGIDVYDDSQMRPIEKEHRHVDWDVAAAEKGGYEHFMLKEIHEQPACHPGGHLPPASEVVRWCCGDLQHDGSSRSGTSPGSSLWPAARRTTWAMVGKYNLGADAAPRSVEVCLASEFRYSDPIVGKGDLVIVISQSGETLDTMAALREAKRRGAHILSIVNVVGSSIARESHDGALYVGRAGDRRGHHQGIQHPAGGAESAGTVFQSGHAGHAGSRGVQRYGSRHRKAAGADGAYSGAGGAHPRHRQALRRPTRTCSSSAGIWTTPCRWRGA